MPPTNDDKAFRWRLEDSYRTVTGNAFAKLVHENGLTVQGPFEGYYYAMLSTTEGQELYRCFGGSFDGIAEQTAVTSNPAAGVTSVDVKTFTGRGRVSFVECSCVADVNAANRQIRVHKVSGANSVLLVAGLVFVASASGTIRAVRGGVGGYDTAYCLMPAIDFAPGDILRVIVNNGQAGDDLTAITYSFKEAL